ncbi:hypothetical protein HPB48_008665 [Haemaphysalis longicornis]|nr:hypothetical protein HPB48_008665 [Haemaphysalis longicornis]
MHVANTSRGRLKFPRASVVSAVLFTEIASDKLRATEHSAQFFSLPRQKEALVGLVFSDLEEDEGLDTCYFGHTTEEVMQLLVNAAANTLLNNLRRRENDKLSHSRNQRK